MSTTSVQPDLSSRPHACTFHLELTAPPSTVFRAWTEQFDRWFAAPGTVMMTARVDVPFFFESRFAGQRHPHYGRFLRLEPDRLIEHTWLTEAGTKGAETVVTLELSPRGDGTAVRFTHAGFVDADAARGHGEAWHEAFAELDRAVAAG